MTPRVFCCPREISGEDHRWHWQGKPPRLALLTRGHPVRALAVCPQAEFSLSYSEVGVLGGLVFFGVSVFSPIAGYLLTQCSSQVRPRDS